MTQRFDIINELIKNFEYKRYLEIGLDKGLCFNNVICKEKVSVDLAQNQYDYSKPTYKMSSDVFFNYIAPEQKKWDIIFIDGLHHSVQVDQDIKNSLKYLNNNGSIVIHDCNPLSEASQIVPRKQRVWNGDVWKSVVKFRNENKQFGCIVVDTDWGCGVINKLIKVADPFDYKLEYASLEKNRKQYLGLINVDEFNSLLLNLK